MENSAKTRILHISKIVKVVNSSRKTTSMYGVVIYPPQ